VKYHKLISEMKYETEMRFDCSNTFKYILEIEYIYQIQQFSHFYISTSALFLATIFGSKLQIPDL